MITARMKGEWRGQKVRFHTILADKEYYWMEDIDGTTWLAKVGENGEPEIIL